MPVKTTAKDDTAELHGGKFPSENSIATVVVESKMSRGFGVAPPPAANETIVRCVVADVL